VPARAAWTAEADQPPVEAAITTVMPSDVTNPSDATVDVSE